MSYCIHCDIAKAERCDRCEFRYTLDNLIEAIREELINPWAIPVLDWLARIIRKAP